MPATGKDELVVCCLKWGTAYGPDYVNTLADMVRRNLSRQHRFVCFTDRPEGVRCETMPIEPSLPHWWGKLTLFRHPVPGRLLYLDLDSVIVGSIDPLAAYDGPFCIVRRYDSDRGYGSAVMSIAPDFGRAVWDRFARDPVAAIAHCRRHADPPWNSGDQRWLELTVPQADCWQDVAPGHVVSYKLHCREGLPPAARIATFHGRPKPHEAPENWVREHWRISTPAQGGGAAIASLKQASNHASSVS
jgi:hypothetical protein